MNSIRTLLESARFSSEMQVQEAETLKMLLVCKTRKDVRALTDDQRYWACKGLITLLNKTDK